MPDMRGMGLKDALFLLENRRIESSVQGRGKVIKPEHRAGDLCKQSSNGDFRIELIKNISVTLQDILYKVSIRSVHGNTSIPVRDLQLDSRKVSEGLDIHCSKRFGCRWS